MPRAGGADRRPSRARAGTAAVLFVIGARGRGADDPARSRRPVRRGRTRPGRARVAEIACNPGCEWLRVFSITDDGRWWLPSSFLTVSGKVQELPVLAP
ncbi:MAG: hypothetical protein U0531_05585 [Dehalococcoidia bacterium]